MNEPAQQTNQPQTSQPHILQPQHRKEDAPAQKKGNVISSIRQHPLFVEILVIMLAVLAIAGWLYWHDLQSKIYIENAKISAPLISLGPDGPGTIENIYVKEGDTVVHGQRLALVGDQPITATSSGIIVGVQGTSGQPVTPQDVVITMVNPDDFRVVGKIEEDKGLKDIAPGQKVVFTVDAFGSKQYNGTVESVGMTPVQSDIVFSISDKRQEQEFEVTALFDTSAYPELKDGMSAKMWVYK